MALKVVKLRRVGEREKERERERERLKRLTGAAA
jgi:hypothetical protein